MRAGKFIGGRGRWEAETTVLKIPRCAACYAPNPRALAACPVCATPAPVTTGFQRVESAVHDDLMPWPAAILMAIGMWFRNLHRNLSRRWNP